MNEHEMQCEVIRWARAMEVKFPELALLYAIPNGGMRNIVEAVKLSAEGVKSGVPDLHLPVARKGFHGLWIEMKTQRGGVSKKQKEWHKRLSERGHSVKVCRSIQQATEALHEYLK